MEIATRRLGRTGLLVPELGIGAMDTPHSDEGHETLRTALELGVTFIDTARDYAGSEFLIGEVLRDPELPRPVIASKTFSRTANGSQWDVDRSLKVLGVGAIDLYQLHDVSTWDAWTQVMADDGALAGLQAAQYRGLVRHIGVSCHDLDVAREAIRSDAFDTVMVEYSAFYPESAPVIELAQSWDVGVIVMRPLGGSGRTSVMRGRLAAGTAGILTPANLLRYVLSNPGVSVAIPGASHPDRVVANVEVARTFVPMAEPEKRALEAAAAGLY
ncbi:MAG: aldo/keto reductase [Dehalococcoidia bacterium]|nr:aldo/keto reductase [Dehalococcoidia bacterium]